MIGFRGVVTYLAARTRFLRCAPLFAVALTLLQTSTGVHGASPSTVANFSAATAAKIFIAAEQPAPSSAATEFTMAKADRVSLLQARACVRTVFSLLGLRERHTSGYMHVHPICCDDPARKLRLGRGRAT